MNEKVLCIVFYLAKWTYVKLLPILDSYLFTNQKNVLISHITNQKLIFLNFFQKKNNQVSNSTMDMDNYYSTPNEQKKQCNRIGNLIFTICQNTKKFITLSGEGISKSNFKF